MPNLVEALQGFREGSTYYAVGDGFYYCLNRTKGTRKFLKCFRHGRYKCMARASFEVGDRVLSVTVNHNHPPEPWVDELLKERHAVKSHATWDPDFLQNNTFGRQQMQEQSGGRDDTNALQATLGMGAVGGPMDTSEAGPSGFGEDFRVKMEPEWVDAGALEPNCELEGQYDDAPDYGMGYGNNSMTGQDDQNYHHQMFSGQQQQPLPLIPDSQDPVKLRVPGKPNLTITVAQNRQGSSQSNAPLPQPPLHLLNPLLRPKRGRPRGSAYGSYNESEDRVTTILTDTIIASRELEKLGAAAYHTPRVTAAMSSPLQNRVKPRSKDPEAVKAADIVNKAQNRSGPNVTQELEKVHLKLRQEVLALEVQNLKAEREKLKVYRRNVAIRREIMMLHLQLGKGIPSECASSGRGLETVDSCSSFMDAGFDNDPPDSVSKEQVSLSKRLPDVSISRSAASQSPKISVRKSLQTSNSSPNISPLSCSSSLKDSTPPPPSVTKGRLEASEQLSGNREPEDPRPSGEGLLDGDAKRNSDVSRLQAADSPVSSGSGPPDNQAGNKKFSEHNDVHRSDGDYATKSSLQQSGSVNDPGKEELVPLDSVSSDLSIEMLSEPGSSQWTNQSSAPMTEHESFDDLHFEGDDSYDNTDEIGEFSGGPASKEPPDSQSQYGSYSDDSAPKRRRVENMWEPDDTPL